MNNFYKRGVTAIEILIILAILVILVVVSVPQFSKIRENQVFKNAVSDTLSAINKARSETLASKNSTTYGVRFESDKVIIFTGTVFSGGAGDNEEIYITSPASISNVTLNGSSGASGEMYFNRLSGVPSKTGTITITSPLLSKVITISATGSASAN